MLDPIRYCGSKTWMGECRVVPGLLDHFWPWCRSLSEERHISQPHNQLIKVFSPCTGPAS